MSRPIPAVGTGPLAGRTAVVTGASRGIGAAVARALDRDGARVVLVARTAAHLEGISAELVNDPVSLVSDLAAPDAPGRLAERIMTLVGGADVLINNAGVTARLPTTEIDAALIDRLYAVNMRAPLLLIAGLLPGMLARGRGVILTLSSVSALVGTPGRAAYAASKGAMDAASRSLAVELGPHGIRVNTVAPGVVDTAMWTRNKAIPGVEAEVTGLTPLGRWGQPEDIADVIAFLASDAARFVTGETIAADGGMARTMRLYDGPA